MVYSIAGFNFEYEPIFGFATRELAPYASSEKADLKIEVTIPDMKAEFASNPEVKSQEVAELNAIYRKLSEYIPLKDAFVLHAATIDVDGIGVAFTAHSGTGKSTHMLLWQKLLGDRLTIVNGDKPFVRFLEKDKSLLAYGTPWNGKERFSNNISTELKHLCFIARSEKNFVEKLDKQTMLNVILNQVYIPKSPEALVKTFSLLDNLLSSCSLWKINCNMEIDAAKVAYETIFGGNNNEA